MNVLIAYRLEFSVEIHHRRLRLALVFSLLLALLLAPAPPAAAHGAGDLDPSFGIGGKVVVEDDKPSLGTGTDIALQADGKIVVVGGGHPFGMLRYNPDGTLDPTFGTNGQAVVDVESSLGAVTGVVIQPDGKIVAVGRSGAGFVVTRFTIAGTLDATFGTDGIVMTGFGGQLDQVTDVALQGEKIVIVGSSQPNATDGSDFAVARYNGDGALDVSFGIEGKRLVTIGDAETAHAVGIQADGKIVLAGESDDRYALVRLLPDGTLDDSFGGDGKVVTGLSEADVAYGLVIQPDGKLVAAGESSRDFSMVRYQADGSLDSGFGSAGIVITDFALARYTPTGALDPSFGACGKVTTDVRGSDSIAALAIDAEDKIVSVGTTVLATIFLQFVMTRHYGELERAAIQVTPATAQGGGRPGERVYYKLRVTNTGNAENTFRVTTSESAWRTRRSGFYGPLAAGGRVDFWVWVDIPTYAAIGQSETVTLLVTSDEDAGVWASSTLTTTARELPFAPYKRYLPAMDNTAATP